MEDRNTQAEIAIRVVDEGDEVIVELPNGGRLTFEPEQAAEVAKTLMDAALMATKNRTTKVCAAVARQAFGGDKPEA